MAESSAKLTVEPAALHGAAEVIGGRTAPLATTSSGAATSMETAGMAGAALDRAVDGYCAAFAQRLSAVAAGLVGAAGAYTGMEAANSQAVASVEVG